MEVCEDRSTNIKASSSGQSDVVATPICLPKEGIASTNVSTSLVEQHISDAAAIANAWRLLPSQTASMVSEPPVLDSGPALVPPVNAVRFAATIDIGEAQVIQQATEHVAAVNSTNDYTSSQITLFCTSDDDVSETGSFTIYLCHNDMNFCECRVGALFVSRVFSLRAAQGS